MTNIHYFCNVANNHAEHYRRMNHQQQENPVAEITTTSRKTSKRKSTLLMDILGAIVMGIFLSVTLFFIAII